MLTASDSIQNSPHNHELSGPNVGSVEHKMPHTVEQDPPVLLSLLVTWFLQGI